jgi:hypothetical protein
MATAKQPLAYSTEVMLFRLGGVALYQSTVDAAAMIIVGLLSPRSESPRSYLVIVLCSTFLLILQMLPSTVLSYVQVMFEKT